MDQATLHSLTVFPLQFEQLFQAVPPDYRHWAPATWDGIPSEPFTAIEQVCHIRDIELDGYHIRFERALHEEDPILTSVDSHGLAHARDYAHADAASAFTAIRTARARTVDLLTSLTAAQLARPARFEGYGSLTVRGLAHYLASHDQQHLAGMQWLLGKIDAHRHTPDTAKKDVGAA